MCSQRAIVDNLECCIDDLVECMEDFIRKSLLLIFLGIGVIVGLLIYLLKILSERTPIINPPTENEIRERNKACSAVEEKIEKEIVCKNLEENKALKTICKPDIKTERNQTMCPTKNLPAVSSFNENMLKNDLSSCSKYECGSGPYGHITIPSRVPVPSAPFTLSKQTLIPCVRKRSLNKGNIQSLPMCQKVTKPGSCCSMCCYDENKQSEDPDRARTYRGRL